MKITATVFDITDFKESESSDYELRSGIRVRRYRSEKSCFEQGIEVSAEVTDISGCRTLLEKLFDLAEADNKSQKAARD